jgi:diguanylate cyclase (GGDEF)-like protein/PAS domain S-box-containing protein
LPLAFVSRARDVLTERGRGELYTPSPELELEVRALRALARHIRTDAHELLRALASVTAEICAADAAGVSVPETTAEGEAVFRWVATAGSFDDHEGRLIPAHGSLCGDCLGSGEPRHRLGPGSDRPLAPGLTGEFAERRVEECLGLPFTLPGTGPVVLWIAAHRRRGYDAGTARLLRRLADFVASALAGARPETGEALLPPGSGTPAITRATLESALRVSEARFRAAFDQAAVGMIETDADGRLRRVNDCFCRIVGYPREELVGRIVWDLTYRPDLAENRRQFDQTVAAAQPSHALEKRYVRRDGSLVWTRVTANVVHPEPDAAAYVLGVVEDITDQVIRDRSRQFLLELNEATQGLVDPDDIMQATAQRLGQHLQVNRCGYAEVERDQDHFRFTGDYACGTFSIVGRFSMSAFGEHALRLMRANRPYVVNDIDAEAPEGMDLDVYRRTDIRAVVCVPLHKQGRFVAGLAVHQNTPRQWQPHEIELVRTVAERCWESIERARVARDLSESEERLRLALDAAEMGVWELDLASDRLTADARFRAIYGLDPDQEITGLGDNFQRVHPRSRASVRAALQAAMNPRSEGERHTLEYRIVTPEGAERWVFATGRVFFRDENGDRRPARLIGTTLDVTERKQLERQLHHSAFHDPLTDLPNRALFVDRLAHVVARSQRHETHYALLVMDVDNFKLVNDSFGHPAGDRLLVELARVLRSHLRPDDTLARFGGDEFCVLMEEIDSESHVQQAVARIQAVLRRQPLFVHDDTPVHASVSIGIAFGHGPRAPTAMIQDADLALYEAKRRGKGGHVVFDPTLRAGPESPLRLERALQRAVNHRRLSVAYQPVVDLATGRAVGCEALARWHHPVFGDVEPSQFIAAAERNGLILPLGEQVLDNACRDLARWRIENRVSNDFYVAVNLSAQQLAREDLVEQVSEVLARYRLTGAHLRLEVTEGSIVRTGEHAASLIRQLRDLGIHVCVDDFGVGYSSLSYLQRFPVSVLKLDRSFIQGLFDKRGSRAIVQTVLDLARNLDMEAVAEGIERPAQRRTLARMGFTRAQGFLFHRPMSANAMAAVCGRRR